jgi:hypothetical protein
MSFIAFRREGKEVILNSDRIISVSFNSEKNKTEIICTDEFTIEVDDHEEDVKKRLGVKKGERTIGFGSI